MLGIGELGPVLRHRPIGRHPPLAASRKHGLQPTAKLLRGKDEHTASGAKHCAECAAKPPDVQDNVLYDIYKLIIIVAASWRTAKCARFVLDKQF